MLKKGNEKTGSGGCKLIRLPRFDMQSSGVSMTL